MSRLLAFGSALGTNTLTLTVAEAQAGSLVQLFPAAVKTGVAFGTSSAVTACADSRSGTWTITNEGTSIGTVHQQIGTSPSESALDFAQGCVRTAGAPLQVGDTITVTVSSDYPADTNLAALVFDIDGILFNAPVEQIVGGVGGIRLVYDNGFQYPDLGSSTTVVSWADISETVEAQQTSVVLGAHVSHPGGGIFTPFNGEVLGSITAGGITLAVSYFCCATAFVPGFDPGGTWSVANDMMVSNYQCALSLPSGEVPPSFIAELTVNR